MTADERLIDLDAANERLASMNLKRSIEADGAIRTVGAEVGDTCKPTMADVAFAFGGGKVPVTIANDTISAGSAIPPEERPTHCNHNVPLNVFCEECAKPAPKPPRARRSDAGTPRPAKPAPVAASTKQEGGAGITEEQAAKLRKLIGAKEEANVNWQNASDAIKLAGDEQARTQIELFEFINGLRAKDAR